MGQMNRKLMVDGPNGLFWPLNLLCFYFKAIHDLNCGLFHGWSQGCQTKEQIQYCLAFIECDFHRFIHVLHWLFQQRALKEDNYTHSSTNVAKLLSVKDKEEQLIKQVQLHQGLLEKEKEHFKDLMGQVRLTYW